jgi:outer membrane protein TolC
MYMNPVTIYRVTKLLPLAFLIAGSAVAQIGVSNAPSQGAVANQLPLSGFGNQTGSVTAVQLPAAGTTTSVNTLNPSVLVVGPYTGSTNGTGLKPLAGTLSFVDAIHRGLDFNLGTEGVSQALRQAQGQSKVVRSLLLPNLDATASETVQQINLRAAGVRINSTIPGITIPGIVGPFNYFDLRAHLTQTIGDLTAWKNYRSAQEIVHANDFALKDARDQVVLAVGGAYLQVGAARQRVVSEQAQLDTATALFDQANQERGVGLVAQIDVNRSRIQMLTEKERLETLRNDLSKQKINLARMIGLPPNDQYDVSDVISFSIGPAIEVDAAVQNAYLHRDDLKATQSQLHAAELARSAARGELVPSLAVNADYGVNGTNPNQSHGTFSATGTLTIPIWRGGRAEGDIQQANATLTQRKAEFDNLRARIEGDIRSALLDMQAAANQVTVAEENVKVSNDNLDLTRQKFKEGVSDNVEVIQAQQTAASAELDLINSVLAHNIAKLGLARAIGESENHLSDYLKLP